MKRNQSGMSLVEILVAIGILSVVAFGTISFMVDSLKMSRNVSLKNDFNSLINQVQLNLNNSSNCLSAFGGSGALNLTGAPGTLNKEVTLNLGGFNLKATAKYGSSLSITSVKLTTATATSTVDQFKVPLVVKAYRLDNNTTGGEIQHTFDLYVTLNAAKSVIACAGEFTNYWNDAINTTAADRRIFFSGDVGIRKDTITSGVVLDVNGTIQASAFLYSSDQRLKENIREITHPLDSILKLRGVKFDWKNKDIYNHKDQLGLIAQEVEKVFPEAVLTDENTGLKSVAYGNLISPLIEAVKQQQEVIQQQQREIEQIKKDLAKALESK